MKPCNPNGRFTVCWDPLDGSSIVDNNWAVGTMIGIWSKESVPARMASSAPPAATRSPRSSPSTAPHHRARGSRRWRVRVFSYGCTPDGCQLPDGTYEPWICSRAKIEVAKDCRIFSPANLRAAKEVAGYKRLVEHYMDDKYTLRYSGGLVPDIYQQFTKNQGVFANPTSDSSPAKLRLAFEAAPFGLLVEKAGGKTSDGVTGGSILDVEITAVDQRTALCIGSANEVDRFNEYLECDDDGCNTSK